MSEPAIHVLLVEDNPSDALLFKRFLYSADPSGFRLTHADRLARALPHLAAGDVGVVLLDLSLPDSEGLASLIRVREQAPRVPVVVLTGFGDDILGLQLVQAGAQDYLVKSQVSGPLLARSLRYAIERKLVEEALRDSEARFRAVFENAAVGIMLLDERGGVSKSNPALQRMLGYSAGELSRLNYSRLVPAEDSASEGHWIRDLLGGIRDRVQGERRLMCKDGGVVWGRLTAECVRLPGGQPPFVLAWVEDVTERRLADEALRFAGDELRRVIESIPDCVWSVRFGPGRRAIFRYLSPAIEQITGKPAGYFMEDPDRLLGIVHPHDLPSLRQALDYLMRGLSSREVAEFRIVRPGGGERWIHADVRLNGNPEDGYRLEGVARDITDRHRAEEASKFLAHAGAAFVASLDAAAVLQNLSHLVVPALADGCLVETVESDGSLTALAYAATDPTRQAAMSLLAGLASAPDERHPASIVLRGGAPLLYQAVRSTTLAELARDADHLLALQTCGLRSLLIVPLVARGRALGVLTLAMFGSDRRFSPQDLAVIEEVAHRASLGVENARLFRETQDAIRRQEEFISLASHEMRTPVTVLDGHVQALNTIVARSQAASSGGAADSVTLDRDRVMRVLGKLEHSSQRLNGLIEWLQNAARLRNRSIPLSTERVDLAVILASVVEDIRLRESGNPAARDVNLSLDAPPAGVWGKWDPGRVEQVLVNLVDNAVKYSPVGGQVWISLCVETGEGLRPTTRAHVIVRDQGIGIPPTELEAVFQPFARGSNAAARNVSGFGLGLAIAHDIVERHGGRIWVESAGHGQGSAFHLLLPGVEA